MSNSGGNVQAFVYLKEKSAMERPLLFVEGQEENERPASPLEGASKVARHKDKGHMREIMSIESNPRSSKDSRKAEGHPGPGHFNSGLLSTGAFILGGFNEQMSLLLCGWAVSQCHCCPSASGWNKDLQQVHWLMS